MEKFAAGMCPRPGNPDWLAVPTGAVHAGVVLNPDGVNLLSWNVMDVIDHGKWEFASWKIDNGKLLRLSEFTIQTRSVNYGDFEFGPAVFAVSDYSDDGWIKIHDILSGNLIQDLVPGVGGTDLALNSDGSRIYIARNYGMVEAWDVGAAKKLYSFRVIPDKWPDTYDILLSLSRDDTLLLTFGGPDSPDTAVRLWNPLSGQLIRDFDRGEQCSLPAGSDPRQSLSGHLWA